MYKALFVVVETGFEFRLTATIVMSGYTVRLQCSFVYNGAFATFSFQGQLALSLQLHGGVVRRKTALF